MFGRNRRIADSAPEVNRSALDRIVADKTGSTEKFNISPFEFVLREAVVELALSTDPDWPPTKMEDAISIYGEYRQQYDAGELDGLVAELDLNEVVSDAGRLATASAGGVFPPRKNWSEPAQL